MSRQRTIPALNGIDHFHLYVADKQQAAQWYKQVMGFEVYQPLNLWDDATGPLTIADSANTVHLALFKRRNQAPSTSLAFKTSKQGFVEWQQHLAALAIDVRVADHQVSESLYFSDPDGNMHEITYYKEALV